MGGITYKALEVDIKKNGLNTQVRLISAQSNATIRASDDTSTSPSNRNASKTEMLDTTETPQRSPIAQQTEPPSLGEASASYEVSKRWLNGSSSDVETSDGVDYVRGVYEVSSPNLNKMQFLDEQYCIRREGNTLMIGNSDIVADEISDITIGGKRLRCTKGLWELLTRKNVKSDVITNSDLKAYKRILELTNAHLAEYELRRRHTDLSRG